MDSGSRLKDALKISGVIWVLIMVFFAALLGILSFYTGKSSELPKWNGWDYLFFCIGEGLLIGIPIASVVALLVCAVIFLWSTPDKKVLQQSGRPVGVAHLRLPRINGVAAKHFTTVREQWHAASCSPGVV